MLSKSLKWGAISLVKKTSGYIVSSYDNKGYTKSFAFGDIDGALDKIEEMSDEGMRAA